MTRFRLRDGTGTIELRFISEDVDRHGNVRLYVRRKGRRKVRLHTQPGTPAFLDEYRAALTRVNDAAPAPKATIKILPGSMAWLINRYYAECAEFKRLAARTKHVRRLILSAFCLHKNDGAKPFKLLETHHLRGRRDEKVDRPESANGMIKALRQVFKWATANKVADNNPAMGVPYFDSETDGYHTWTMAEVRQFEATHPIGTKARLAMALLRYTGQRRSDVVKMGSEMVRDEAMTITQQKRHGKKKKTITVTIPIRPELRAIIEASQIGTETYLETEYGKPFTSAGFGNRFREWCDQAGLPQCSAHGLRKTLSTDLAERGATERQIMSVTGHTTSKEVGRYTRAASQKVMAAQAMELLDDDPEE